MLLEVGGSWQKTEVGGRKSEIRDQRSEIRGQQATDTCRIILWERLSSRDLSVSTI